MTSSKNLIYYLLPVLLLTAHAHSTDEPGCAHGLIPSENIPLDVEEDFIVPDGRNLATTSYPAIRIYADYTRLTQGTTEFQNYVKTSLFPAVSDYFTAALAVKQPLTSNLKISATTVCGGYAIPTALLNGVATDLFVLVTATSDTTSNWVASAGACYISSTTGRPIVALMTFNLAYTTATTDPLVHEKNTYLTMHEMIHAFGFTQSSFSNFIDPTTGKKTHRSY